MPLSYKPISRASLKPNSKLGRCVIEERLGRGGVGSVYRVKEESTGRVLALKTQERRDEHIATLFEREYHIKAWQTQPVPPSEIVPEIPTALDQLVLSLVSFERLGRPSSAAEVIDRLCAIAGLDEEPLDNIAEGHLLSPAFW